MGLILSSYSLRYLNETTAVDIQNSLRQILHAFEQELLTLSSKNKQLLFLDPSFQSKRGRISDHYPHTAQEKRKRAHSTEIQTKTAEQLDPISSPPSRRWKCKFCLEINERENQICAQCGSTKVNVYIPLEHHSNDMTSAHDDINNHNRQACVRFVPSSPKSVLWQKIGHTHHHRRDHFQPSHQHQRNESLDDHDQTNHHFTSHRRSVLIAHKREADEHIVLKDFEKLLEKCLLTNSRFHDDKFPGNNYSLYINGHSLSNTTIQLLPDQQHVQTAVQWLRPDKIFAHDWTENVHKQWTVFRDPKPNDVLQGALGIEEVCYSMADHVLDICFIIGDCWFITALSVLAEKPEYLMKVLITKEYNREGIYYVRLCKDGMWTQVLVDDRFPCTKFQTFAYSQAHRKQLWVPLIEKALAKLNGSYEAIIAGRCCEGSLQ
ncbi:unnamed protein product [Didymodactylos carnosus]|uniref:Calpain catalytic domain-containing protein n=1 Tax=Didymodactylos carnosus TaxID=1234261 RepID=A0A813ZGG1_9BILA|nr:unnamed protein product [Didymodactylos carnosus]CAF3680617.1 unnamed protein product [Didymodactylos carnosus]